MSPKKERVRSIGVQQEEKRPFFPWLQYEAKEARESADRYTSFAMMFTCAAIAVVIPLLPRFPFVALLSIPLMLIIAGAIKSLVFRHQLVHRHRGFELFWDKIGKDRQNDRRILDISFEEAQRAFSVVAPVFFSHIYERGALWRELKVKNAFLRKQNNSSLNWFLGQSAPRSDLDTWPQSELGTTLRLLHLMMILAAVPILVASTILIGFYFFSAISVGVGYSPLIPFWLLTLFIAPAGICIAGYLPFRIFRDRAEVEMMETGLYSPHALMVLWHAVAKAHQEVSMGLVNDATYLTALQEKAEEVVKKIDDIFAWLENRRCQERMVLDDSVDRDVALQINFTEDRDDIFSPPLLLDPFRGELLDLSVDGSGLGIFANLAHAEAFGELEQLGKGAAVTLNLPQGSGLGDIPLKGELKNIIPLGDHKWRMGIAVENQCHLHHCIHHIDASETEDAEEIECVMCDNYLVQQWYRSQVENPDIPIN